jgi:23S rRNA (adenine2503-C2)-methyltransferase
MSDMGRSNTIRQSIASAAQLVYIPSMHAPLPDLMGLPYPDLGRLLDRIGVGAKHAGRVFRGVHHHRLALDAIPDLGRHAAVIAAATRQSTARIVADHQSEDGTRRLMFALDDGARIEGVLIPMRPDRATLCISSQVGCAMACTFCATGTMGLTRGLGAGEILAQVHAARAVSDRPVRNLVFMGMGEPLHHYAATRDAVRILLDTRGLSYKARHVTVSTVGVLPKMRSFAADFGGRVQLALSLHAGTDAVRQQIIPLAKTYDMANLRAACLDHPLPGSRRLMIEYVVLPGVNDTDAELAALAEWTRGIDCLVNLIPFNPFRGAPFRAPTVDEVNRAAAALKILRVPHTVRWPRGRGVDGACGQLALREAAG